MTEMTPFEKEVLEGMESFVKDLESGVDIKSKYRVTTVVMLNEDEITIVKKLVYRGKLRRTKPTVNYREHFINGKLIHIPIDGEAAYVWRRVMQELGLKEGIPKDLDDYLGEVDEVKLVEKKKKLEKLVKKLIISDFFRNSC